MGEGLEKPGKQQRGWCGACKLSSSGAGENQSCLDKAWGTLQKQRVQSFGDLHLVRGVASTLDKIPIKYPCKIQF